MRAEWKVQRRQHLEEIRIIVIRLRQRLREQILLQIMVEFVAVRHRAIGLVRALRQQQQIANPVAVRLEIVLLVKLVSVLIKLVRPDMLNLANGLVPGATK